MDVDDALSPPADDAEVAWLEEAEAAEAASVALVRLKPSG